MVKIEGPPEYDKLEQLMRNLAEKHGFRLDTIGWTRKTYDFYTPDVREGPHRLLARVESIATTNGEIRIFDDSALPFAEDLGPALERDFSVTEAVVIRQSPAS